MGIAKRFNQVSVFDWKAKADGKPERLWYIDNPYFKLEKESQGEKIK